MPFYVNRFNVAERRAASTSRNGIKTTVFQTNSREEARNVLACYTANDAESCYYITGKPCKGWTITDHN